MGLLHPYLGMSPLRGDTKCGEQGGLVVKSTTLRSSALHMPLRHVATQLGELPALARCSIVEYQYP